MLILKAKIKIIVGDIFKMESGDMHILHIKRSVFQIKQYAQLES